MTSWAKLMLIMCGLRVILHGLTERGVNAAGSNAFISVH